MKLPRHYYSWTTMIGIAIALISFALIVFLFIVTTFFNVGTSYSGLFIYIILPAIMVIGMLLIPIGIIRKRARERDGKVERHMKFPVLDFNDSKQRFAIMIFSISTAVFLLLSAMGSYEAFHYTESNEFCGTLCHKVMEPEYTAYQKSAHARVNCVECHVGSGASWYVKSKLSGLYQVYSVMAKAYPTPIPTPIHNLRPAQETCEKCHWPEKFYDRKYVTHMKYLADEQTSEWDIQLLMKTSPDNQALGLENGIHWHINPKVNIEYVASNMKRESVLWVKYTNLETGEVSIYKDENNEVDEAALDTLEHRRMDCLDCHNRPSHDYLSPSKYFDEAVTAGKISRNLPEIKLEAMGILARDFPTLDSAYNYIESKLVAFYKSSYPEVLDTNQAELYAAIEEIQHQYSQNAFPFMKVKWSDYPNYLGHQENPGCFRCHNDNFKSETGRVISRDCNLCHIIKAQGEPEAMQYAVGDSALIFKHPVDIDEEWKTSLCSDCHSALY
jgi:hypothetical protein